MTVEATVVRRAYFERPAFNGYGAYETVWITTLVERAPRACLVVKSTSFRPEA